MNLKKQMVFIGLIIFTITIAINYINTSVVYKEAIINGGYSAENSKEKLLLKLDSSGLKLEIVGCKEDQYTDKFYLHAYVGHSDSKTSVDNFDFFLSDLKVERVDNGQLCIYSKEFNLSNYTEIALGQYSMPNGNCCKIIWGRDYVIKN